MEVVLQHCDSRLVVVVCSCGFMKSTVALYPPVLGLVIYVWLCAAAIGFFVLASTVFIPYALFLRSFVMKFVLMVALCCFVVSFSAAAAYVICNLFIINSSFCLSKKKCTFNITNMLIK